MKRRRCHGAAPHHGRVLVGQQESHGHALDAVVVQRKHQLGVGGMRRRGTTQTHQGGYRGSVDVGIQDAHTQPMVKGQRDGEVDLGRGGQWLSKARGADARRTHSSGRLAHATLARHAADHVARQNTLGRSHLAFAGTRDSDSCALSHFVHVLLEAASVLSYISNARKKWSIGRAWGRLDWISPSAWEAERWRLRMSHEAKIDTDRLTPATRPLVRQRESSPTRAYLGSGSTRRAGRRAWPVQRRCSCAPAQRLQKCSARRCPPSAA